LDEGIVDTLVCRRGHSEKFAAHAAMDNDAERITTLSERYLCHGTQKSIVARHANAIVAAAGGDRSSPQRIVE